MRLSTVRRHILCDNDYFAKQQVTVYLCNMSVCVHVRKITLRKLSNGISLVLDIRVTEAYVIFIQHRHHYIIFLSKYDGIHVCMCG